MIAKICGIYKILNIITMDYYLGGSYNIKGRFYDHHRKLVKNIHGNCHLQRAWNKYGEQAFEFTVILLCDREHKLYFEDGFLKLFKPAYNIATDALAPMQGRNHTDETRHTMSETRTGHINTEETKQKMSKAHKGEQNYLFGKHLSKAIREKMSAAQRGELNHNFGKHFTDATRTKMGEAHTGKYPNEETKCKLRERIMSKETKQKISESVTNYWRQRKCSAFAEDD